MATFSSRQWLAILASVLLLVSFFLINRKPPATEANKPPIASGHTGAQPAAMDFGVLLDEAKKQVPAEQQPAISQLEAELSGDTGEARVATLKALINAYDTVGDIIPATYYAEKLAEMRNSADLWYKAADRYYSASEIGDESARLTLVQKASQCYTNSYRIDSTNLDTKVGIGKCLVELSPAPMQGIGIIKEVVKQDSNNLQAQLALGELSIQSSQFPNALYRYKRVLQIKPSYGEAYLSLAYIYQKTGNKQEEINNLEKYSTFVPDKKSREEVIEQIKKLKNDTLTNQ